MSTVDNVINVIKLYDFDEVYVAVRCICGV